MKAVQHKKQKGVAAVEFALIALLLFTLLIGMMEFGRIVFSINAATEATRLGARLAVVCDKDDSIIKNKMIELTNFIDASNIEVIYTPSGCDINTCSYITVNIINLQIPTIIPAIPFNFNMPKLSTTLPRESMTSANNAIC